MARKINVKLILELRAQGMSMNEISQTRRISKHSVSRTCKAAHEKGVSFSEIQDMAENTLYHLLFSEKHAYKNAFATIDMEYVHKELGKISVILKLLHGTLNTSMNADIRKRFL